MSWREKDWFIILCITPQKKWEKIDSYQKSRLWSILSFYLKFRGSKPSNVWSIFEASSSKSRPYDRIIKGKMMGFITLHKAGSFLRRSALRYPSIRMSNEKKRAPKGRLVYIRDEILPRDVGIISSHPPIFGSQKVTQKKQHDSSGDLRGFFLTKAPGEFPWRFILPRNWPGTAPSEHSHPEKTRTPGKASKTFRRSSWTTAVEKYMFFMYKLDEFCT